MTSTDEAIEAIYAASLDPAGWSEAVAQVGALFHTATGSLYVSHGTSDEAETEVLASFGHSGQAVADYLSYYATINPFDTNPDRFAVGEVITGGELDRRLRVAGAFERSEFFNDWVRPQHFRHLAGCYVDRSDGGTLCAAFYRPADADEYSASDVETFGRLMRHATRSVEIGVRLQTAKVEMSALLGHGSAAVITLGRDGTVRQRNAAADALLASACGLTVRGGHLRTAIAQDQLALDRLIACAFDRKRLAWAEHARLGIHRTDGGLPLTVRIAACGHRFGTFAPDRVAAAVLTIEGFEAETAARTERLRRRFGLTPAQTRLALLLRSGKSLRAAADELGIGHETARSHLKGVFARTDTRRQAELVLLLREIDGL